MLGVGEDAAYIAERITGSTWPILNVNPGS
jgi:hypothetical protein